MNSGFVRKFLAVAVMMMVAGVMVLSVPTSAQAAPTKWTNSYARTIVYNNGMTVYSSGGCQTRSNSSCTSLEQVNANTINNLVTLKNSSGCSTLTITGGTEVGHAGGTYSHYNGYKVDIRHLTCVDNYIKNTFTYIGLRGDGAKQWKSAAGNVYADEGSHWDITYY